MNIKTSMTSVSGVFVLGKSHPPRTFTLTRRFWMFSGVISDVISDWEADVLLVWRVWIIILKIIWRKSSIVSVLFKICRVMKSSIRLIRHITQALWKYHSVNPRKITVFVWVTCCCLFNKVSLMKSSLIFHCYPSLAPTSPNSRSAKIDSVREKLFV